MYFFILHLISIIPKIQSTRKIGNVYAASNSNRANSKISEKCDKENQTCKNSKSYRTDNSYNYVPCEYEQRIKIKIFRKKCDFTNNSIKLIHKETNKKIKIASFNMTSSYNNRSHEINIYINDKLDAETTYLVKFSNTHNNFFFIANNKILNLDDVMSYIGEASDNGKEDYDLNYSGINPIYPQQKYDSPKHSTAENIGIHFSKSKKIVASFLENSKTNLNSFFNTNKKNNHDNSTYIELNGLNTGPSVSNNKKQNEVIDDITSGDGLLMNDKEKENDEISISLQEPIDDNKSIETNKLMDFYKKHEAGIDTAIYSICYSIVSLSLILILKITIFE
ncbi:hypothetical protein TCON_1144 [Astathelohania contejeani]|uniref:Uncharacterized protein n=1 Tax=Astathelohania contejeani TaxID=164912 RepID=A0ABQ7HZT6_9MICR|nr:hypothetical protein TCON_1144 [Thelohania contejeani]